MLQLEGPGGERNLARGTAIFMQGVKRPQFADAIAELDRIGGRSNFFKERESIIDRIPGLKQLSKYSHDKLWEYDTAQRLGSTSSSNARSRCCRTTNAARASTRSCLTTRIARRWPRFSPRSARRSRIGACRILVGKCAARTRIRPDSSAWRGEQDYNDDVTGKRAGYTMNFATPLDEGAKAATDPMGYFASSLGGPIKTALPYFTHEKTVQDFAGDVTDGTAAGALARAFVPEVGMAESITGVARKYPTHAPQKAAAIGAIFGAYPLNDESSKQKRIEELMKLGMARHDATNYATYHR